jgi:cell division protein FtsL
MVVGFATLVSATASSIVLSVPIAQIAVFVAQHLGTLALAPLIEQIIVAASVSGVTGVLVELVWTKHQVTKLTGVNDTLLEERNSTNAERNTMSAERDAMSDVRDLAVIERDTATALMENAIAQRDTAITGRDAAFAERDAAIIERDAAIEDRNTSIDENTNLTSRVTALEDDMRQLIARINASLSNPAADLGRVGYIPASPSPSVQEGFF